jgi:hypothetical protein
MQVVCQAVYDFPSSGEFSFMWLQMLADYDLGAYCDWWFETLYDMRHRWVPVLF